MGSPSHKHPESCQDVFALLSQYLDLELPSEACQDIEGHLAGCEPCVEFVQSLRKTVDLCRSYVPDVVPEPISGEARENLLSAYQKMLAARNK